VEAANPATIRGNLASSPVDYRYDTPAATTTHTTSARTATLVAGTRVGGVRRQSSASIWLSRAAKVAGSGPAPGVLEVSGRMASSAAVRNFSGKRAVEFVYDPAVGRFAMGRARMGSGSPHQQLARSIDADEAGVVGGMIRRDPSGRLVTNEFSGHFHQNWTPALRDQFQQFMRRYDVDVQHGAGF
jgi:Bacterial toxin 43